MLVREVCEIADKNAIFRAKTAMTANNNRRELSIVYPNGTCEYTPGLPFPAGQDNDGVLVAAFPASGIRLAWMHIEGLTEILVGDDFDCEAPGVEREGIMKTQYPHVEGIWSWADNMKDVALLLRNPRTSIPAYHSLLAELYYAHDCETALKYQHNLFTSHPPVENWTKWRDYRFHEELDLWRWFIDFWMENGTKYWMDLDYERNGQFPFAWVPYENRTKDLNCIHQKIDCAPKIVIAYEYINHPILGPREINKLAKFMEGRKGIEVIEESARPCIFEATLKGSPYSSGGDRVGSVGAYNFTYDQLLDMLDMVNGVKAKYSTGIWKPHPVAKDISRYLSGYAVDIGQVILDIEISGVNPPTTAPIVNYQRGLTKWYASIGRGNRYGKAKVQKMFGFWPKVKHLYPEDDDYDEFALDINI